MLPAEQVNALCAEISLLRLRSKDCNIPCIQGKAVILASRPVGTELAQQGLQCIDGEGSTATLAAGLQWSPTFLSRSLQLGKRL